MAYTSVIPVRRLDRAVKYVMNKEKTTAVSLQDALDYAANRDKTEQSCFESSYACTLETAFADMRQTKERWHKSGGVQGYHLVQSFAAGEVSPELAHQIAKELADRVLGGRYEYVIGTHLNTGHIHSHIVWNSVSRIDGKKYHSNGKSYVTQIRAVSDELCRKYKLSVIDTENSNHVAKPYAEWRAEKNGQPTWRTAIRQDVDDAIGQSLNAVKNLLQTIDAERLFQRPPLLSMGKEIAAGVTDTEQKVEQIILEVTEQCNFRCKYCVYSEDFSGNRDFGNRRMPTEIAFKAIDWALENSGAKLAITFYGGEPLLNFKLMKAVIERSQAKRGNKEIVYSFTSNMSLMTREIATYLAQVPNLYIMASIDGPRTVHDAYRVYANDAPTFEDSIGGLRILADAYAGSHMPVNINAVLTPPFGFEKLEQVNAYFESLDWLPATCHVNITYPSYGTCPGLDEYYDKITGNPKYALHGMCNPLMIWQQRKAETDGLDAYKARNIYYHSIFDDLVKINNRIIVDEPTLRRGLNGCCVPGKKRLYVTATGEYKACERIGSSPSIGNVDEGVDRELIVKKYVEEFAAQSKDICDKCWAYNLCRVCYAGVCNENGLDMGLKNEACRASRSVALNNLALYHELMEENPEALNCLKDAVIE